MFSNKQAVIKFAEIISVIKMHFVRFNSRLTLLIKWITKYIWLELLLACSSLNLCGSSTTSNSSFLLNSVSIHSYWCQCMKVSESGENIKNPLLLIIRWYVTSYIIKCSYPSSKTDFPWSNYLFHIFVSTVKLSTCSVKNKCSIFGFLILLPAHLMSLPGLTL